MDLNRSLFTGSRVCLGPIDYEKDPQVEAKWTHDPEYMRMLAIDPVRPHSPEEIKKYYQKIEKQVEEKKSLFYFTIRDVQDDRLLGFSRIFWIAWTHGTCRLQLGIGEAQERRKGIGSEALSLVLQFIFDELNLHRVTVQVPEYNPAAKALFEKFGFVLEVRQREALNRFGQRWDNLWLGLLRQEWSQQAFEIRI